MCKICQRAFINAQNEEICPKCMARLNELYLRVRDFLKTHERDLYTSQDISEILDIDLRDVVELVNLGFIDFALEKNF
jgi:hypothetical protein